MKEPQNQPQGNPGTGSARTDPERGNEEQRKELAQLAGSVAHDFNNLLSVISGYADLLRVKLAKKGPVPEELGEIEKAAAEAAALARKLFDIPVRPPSGEGPRDRDALDATGVEKHL
jgi:signal transduction histidine kinase